MITIKLITSTETIPVRQPVLRPGKSVDACIFEGDDLPSTIHLGIYEDDAIAGVVSIFRSGNINFKEGRQYQLRGMAVLESHQKKGLGEQLLQAAEKLILEQDGELIWFNAREVAVGFYKKSGYEIIGNPFPIADIGTHFIMFKKMR